jgi:hypothetical protein
MEPRLKTELWVQAQVRLCDIHFIPIAVRYRGDPDAGAVLLRLLRDGDRSLLLRRVTTSGGALAWMVAGGAAEVEGPVAEAYITRERSRDSDLWVVEIDDPRQRYPLDGPIQR